ncbi:MAG: hypothetical protein A3G33_02045 [Omnitrophica bacterium RIFCSPLOWO2_12_FULL_44_17]|uniref:Glycosyltransferase subfamily 4-like N-terminal domain-containing protein n=1 Tax=Candidatus Danuiimicrobium aquiferis TaxID=1801832 RepID=A0A1G1KT60_9BACT|nr:MAG: hypothetical protein A3B72_04155 [Omnitrophica bacterium RIFCSPHIGHO2_02_FULL_45_28]OGW88637.1 MAG: hypothetical protein A3E74_03340 [Omnitrophica bacterium RIFCSPHIGHO2_12_FULL_44_12]OGW96118.1 MAG: hypothetical protein A3G33_02045 [Omnitrophica bacterium RIFCSPLOWO2_12_FULL_44_17]OGX04664.1 MAG: hypothetical protein A3J12_11515 [Omnitrophica bacterium RIFCSPLOWO2_02_FULL_44_11]
MKTILMICHAYPPVPGVGSLRNLGFSRHLPSFGWQPTVLTTQVPPTQTLEEQALLNFIPETIKIIRTPNGFQLNPKNVIIKILYFLGIISKDNASQIASGHSIYSGLPSFLSRTIPLFRLIFWPEGETIWTFTTLLKALSIVKDFDCIYSSSPPAACHVVASLLKKITKKPWIADMRDPLVKHHYYSTDLSSPINDAYKSIRRFYKAQHAAIERDIVTHADKVIVVSPEFKDMLSTSYPEVPPDKFISITNGYDEDIVSHLKNTFLKQYPNNQLSKLKITLTGTIYAPHSYLPLLRTIKAMKNSQTITTTNFELKFVGHDFANLHQIIRNDGIDDVIKIVPRVSFAKAYEFMFEADILLVVVEKQLTNVYFHAKLFPYMIIGKPILCLSAGNNPVTEIIKSCRLGNVVPCDNELAIQSTIAQYIDKFSSGRLEKISPTSQIMNFDRKTLTKNLAELLDDESIL